MNPVDVVDLFVSNIPLRNLLGDKTRDGIQIRALSLSGERDHDAISAVTGLEVVVSSIQSVRVTDLMDGRTVRENELTLYAANWGGSLDELDKLLDRIFRLGNVTKTSIATGVDYAAVIGATAETYFDSVVEAATYKLITGAPKYLGVQGEIVEPPDDGSTYARQGGQWVTAVDAQQLSRADGGYEFTGGFADRSTGAAGASALGSNVFYTQEMVNDQTWLRLGFSAAQQQTNDFAYWTEPTPAPTAGVGLFGGSYMPSGVTSMFDFGFSASSYSDAVTTGDLQYTAADGSFDFSQCLTGDLALVRFDFNVLPQIANTTLEVALIWQTRLSDGTPTFTFALTGDPQFYGTGTVGRTFLARPLLSAYFASQEDVNARALLAIRTDNPIQIQPLTTLTTIQR